MTSKEQAEAIIRATPKWILDIVNKAQLPNRPNLTLVHSVPKQCSAP